MAPLYRVLVVVLVLSLWAAFLEEHGAHGVPLRVPMAPMEDDDGTAGDLADGEDDVSAEADSTGTRPVAILEHRQELQDDGTFNYAFSADNGLTQNEAFHPDGSRTGSYSYVDPKGETILVKYRADRFGFHVLDGSSIPSTPPHVVAPVAPNPVGQSSKGSAQLALSDYGRSEGVQGVQGVQGVLDPNYFNFPSGGFGNLKTAATSGKGQARGLGAKQAKQAKQARLVKPAGRPGLGGKGAAKSAASKQSGGRARSSASSSLHYLQREAREAFVSDVDGNLPGLRNARADIDVVDDGREESRVALRAVRAPPGMAAAASAASANDVDAGAEGMVGADDGNYDHHALKYDDGSYEPHAMKYDDGSYEPHAAKYDDGSYEKHVANYDDGSYEKHVANYDDGSYEPHAAMYDDGSYAKYSRLYDDGSYKHGDAKHESDGEGESQP